jgi:hypothetical protein
MSAWDDLTDGQREGLAIGEQTLAALHNRAVASAGYWRDVGKAASDLLHLAMAAGHTNKPSGRPYTKAWGELAVHTPQLAHLHKTLRSHAVWLYREWDAVSAWLDTLDGESRLRLQHPTMIRRAWDKRSKPPAKRDEEKSETKLVLENAKLREQLESLQNGEGRTITKRLPTEQQADMLADILSADRLEALAAALLERVPSVRRHERVVKAVADKNRRGRKKAVT